MKHGKNMYCEFYKLADLPFQQTGDAGAFFYLSNGHDTARSYIDYLIRDSDGIGVIMGEAGTGKTATLNHVLAIQHEVVVTARLAQPDLAPTELLLAVCMQFGIEAKKIAAEDLAHAIEQFALRQHLHSKVVTIIADDAHKMSRDAFQQLRALARPDKHGCSKLNVLLVGRPQLEDLLEITSDTAPRQQIRFTYTLQPLMENEIGGYIQHRLSAVDAGSELSFSADLVPLIYRYTGGVPVLVNTFCGKVLDAACERQLPGPDAACVTSVIEELGWEPYTEATDIETRMVSDPLHPLPPVGAKLIVRNQGEVIGEHLLKKERVLLGRQSDKDIFIRDKRVSRSHAQLVRINNKFFLQDLNSSNGTFLGKKKIQWHSLRNGDVFRIGGHEIEYVEHQDETVPAPATIN